MAFKRREQSGTVDDEREALREQRRALDDLKQELTERVRAVHERELELRQAITDVGNGKLPPAGLTPPIPRGDDAEPAALRAREAELDRREAALKAQLASLPDDVDTGEDALAYQRREQELAAREQAARELEATLEARAAEIAALPPPDPDAARLAQIEERLAELREAEKLFLRTRGELAARSEAVAARERLISQRERELDEREDGVGGWSNPELTEMEARLRKLEQQQPGEQTLGFSGGFKKLQQEGTRTRKPA